MTMNDNLIYTDTRPRARSTGHAFGFEGNLGFPVIISGMGSVFILTMLLNGDNGMPLFAKFVVALLPTVLTIAYIVTLRSRKAAIRCRSVRLLDQRTIVSTCADPTAASVCSKQMIASLIGACDTVAGLFTGKK